MNLNPIDFNYIDGENIYPLQEYVDEQLNNLVSNNIYTSNIYVTPTKKLNEVIYYSTSNLNIENNTAFGQIQFKTSSSYPNDTTKTGTIIDFTGKLKVYHNYNGLQPLFAEGYYDVESEILQLKADGVSADLQFTALEAGAVYLQEQITLTYGMLQTNTFRTDTLIAGMSTATSFQSLQAVANAGDISAAGFEYLNIMANFRDSANLAYNRSLALGAVAGVAIGLGGALTGYLQTTREENIASNILMSNIHLTSAEKTTILNSNIVLQSNIETINNINRSLSNLVTYQGFINSNVATAQIIPNIKASTITINNTGSATYSLINFSNATNNSAGYVGLGGIVSGYHNNNMVYNTPGAHIFNVPGQTSLSIPAFAINSFGNVGIGINPSSWPLYRFSVAGDVYIHNAALRTNSIIYNGTEISTTLNNYVLKSGSTMTGTLTTNSIIYNAQELSTTLNNYLLLSGGTMTDTLLFNTGLYANPGPYPNGFDGDRIILNAGIGTNGYPYSVGINTDVFWNCAPASASYKWYSGATNTATLDNTGLLTLPSITTTADLAVNGKSQLLGYSVIGYPYFDFEAYASASIFTTKAINLILKNETATEGGGIIVMNNIGSNASIAIGGTSATPTILRNNLYLLSQNGILFNTGNNTTETPNIIILSNGNVGIGTSNPPSKLYVNGTTTMTAQLAITANSANSLISLTNTHTIGQGILQTNNLGGYARLTYYNSGAGGYYTGNYVLEASSNSAAIVMNTGGNTSNSIPRFILNSSGNIGVGISNPSNKLEVAGNISQTGYTFTIGNSTGGVTLNLTDIVNAAWQIKTGGYNLSFFNNEGGTFSNRVVFMRYGNVGIGTDNAASLLHIKGTNPQITVMAQGGSGASSTLNLTTYNNTTNAPSCSLSATDTGDYGATFQIKQKLAGADTNGQFTSFIMDKDGNAAFNNTTYASTKLYVNGKARFEDVVTFTTGNWNMSRDGVYRTYYGNNSTSYYSCGNDANLYAHYFMKSASQSYGPICIMKNDGNIDTYGNITSGSNSYVYAGAMRIGGWDANSFYNGFRDIGITCDVGKNINFNIWGGNGTMMTVNNNNVVMNTLTRSRNYHNYGTTLDYRTSFDGTNGPGWYMITNSWWQDISTVSYVCVAITCLGQNAVWFGRIFIGQGGGFYQTICDMRNPNGGTNTIDVSDVWNSGGVNALKIVINNATYGGQFNVKFSG